MAPQAHSWIEGGAVLQSSLLSPPASSHLIPVSGTPKKPGRVGRTALCAGQWLWSSHGPSLSLLICIAGIKTVLT